MLSNSSIRNFLRKCEAYVGNYAWLTREDLKFIEDQLSSRYDVDEFRDNALEILVDFSIQNVSITREHMQRIGNMFFQWQLRMDVLGEYDISTTLYSLYCSNNHLYDPVLNNYSTEEWQLFEEMIDHDRDMNLTLFGGTRYRSVFLLQDRATDSIKETPQFALMLMAMTIFADEQPNTRTCAIRELYDALSLCRISLATPIMSNLRTRLKNYASCMLIDVDDSIDSITSSLRRTMYHTVQKAGLGLNLGRIRAKGSSIRYGDVVHTGNTAYYKVFQETLHACHRGGMRHGAATTFFPIFHAEIMTLISLKNNRNTEADSVRHLDHTIQIRDIFYTRLQKGEDITLFSPHHVTDLYEAFFKYDKDTFEALYIEKENDPLIPKSAVSSVDLFTSLINERAQTGRVYIQNVDHCSTHSSFNTQKASIYGANLCLEVVLPTEATSYTDRSKGEISQCFLGAVNLGHGDDFDTLDKSSSILVRVLDQIISHSDYQDDQPMMRGALGRRSIGIGVTNLAYNLAKNSMSYGSDECLNHVHKIFENIQWSCLNASNQLAKTKGPCPLFNDTKYAEGLLPIDHYNKNVDSLGNFTLKLDWEKLRSNIKDHGLRNSTLTCCMPSEVSSSSVGATNGIEPIRDYIVIKQSTYGSIPFVVPQCLKLGDKYTNCWNNITHAYLKTAAVIQKFLDQAISTNCYYNAESYPQNRVPLQVILKDILRAHKMGIKTLYYHNTADQGTSAHCESCQV